VSWIAWRSDLESRERAGVGMMDILPGFGSINLIGYEPFFAAKSSFYSFYQNPAAWAGHPAG